MSDAFSANAATIRNRVEQAATRADRDPASVTVVAVSKTFPHEDVMLAYANGFRVFGESRVQEIREKFANSPLPADAQLHLIGSLQSNKIKQVLPFISMMETLDRGSIVPSLEKALAANQQSLDVLIQVNISGESQKSGVVPSEAIVLLKTALATTQVRPVGLMTMAPLGAGEQELRAVFGGLRTLRDDLQQQAGLPLPVLSMGMSDDFEIAIEEGATHVRLGRSLFGAR